jgi:polyisoprenyl-teichoic acid--peptidoglycan teichoic acid transferase
VWLLVSCGLGATLLIVWALAGFLAVRSGVESANRRLPAGTISALARQKGSLLTSPTDILLLSVDHPDNASAERATDDNSDAMMLVRTDPTHHRIVFLSIPRDLQVDVPGYGEQKINSAMQFGGARLAIHTVEQFTGLPVNHVAIVNFSSFEQLINALGGIEIDVPENILSNRFDCPYATEQRCLQWQGWRFRKGWQHMNGRQALIYSRIRDNQLNPADTDITREEHQQQVMDAALGELVSFGTFAQLPFDGASLLTPLSTDLSSWQFLELGWVKLRAGTVLHCHLGGTPTTINGLSFLLPSPANAQVIAATLGQAPPLPPASTSLYAPGCLTAAG